ncbi:SDR family oxidoreductase [Mesorhizobium sp. VK23B]|uniref:SDR family oxidoreductase n=1 Tax=Mesorhizobium dulcispinae TaxID=3072316 RepID=A0ABU4XG62_9HYPH|nr:MULTISPECIES: SDR family oxidoreductase [unclassified Mesorhizobium]MDX8466900.1 SDR family oxidoreductase [Mesorhizobium sp. VK23B]MDX8473523.1 SDR family oxidoreductase [Mesorhizobium sp. VK23A]
MSGRIAVVTGASSGIGAATALRIAKNFEGLVLHARKSVESLENIAAKVRSEGAKAVTVLGDLTDAATGERLVRTASEAFGRLDCVIANAGFPILKSFDQGTLADLEYGFRGNVFSFFSITRAAAPLLAKSAAGRVVAVGSFTASVFRTDVRQFPMSAASKGALETAVRSLAMYLAPKGVTVNCVVPGFIQKEAGAEDSVTDDELAESRARIPLGRIGQPEDVAAAIEFLLSTDAGYITGQSLHVSGGLRI